MEIRTWIPRVHPLLLFLPLHPLCALIRDVLCSPGHMVARSAMDRVRVGDTKLSRCRGNWYNSIRASCKYDCSKCRCKSNTLYFCSFWREKMVLNFSGTQNKGTDTKLGMIKQSILMFRRVVKIEK